MGVKIREKIRGSGIYWVFAAQDGRRRSWKAGPLDVAKEVAKRITIKLTDDPDSVFKQREAPKPQFKRLAEEWIIKVGKRAKASTVERYEQILEDYVWPFVGTKRVNEIKRAHIADAIEAAQDKKLSVASLELIRTCFSGPLEIAAFREMIPANPVNGILKQMSISRTTEKKQTSGSNLKFLTPDQINLFLGVCGQHWPEYRHFFQFLFMTGTRLGEALAFTWDDIFWDDKVVTINKSFRRRLGSTKTGVEREVDIPDVMVDALKRLHTKRKREALRTGSGLPGVVFHRNGSHMSQNTARNVFKRVLKKAALPCHRIHDSRHSYASLMLKNGASLDYVKRMLGHSNIAMTSNIYGHLMPNRDRTQVNLLGNALLKSDAPCVHPESTKAVNP
jgi:integrase